MWDVAFSYRAADNEDRGELFSLLRSLKCKKVPCDTEYSVHFVCHARLYLILSSFMYSIPSSLSSFISLAYLSFSSQISWRFLPVCLSFKSQLFLLLLCSLFSLSLFLSLFLWYYIHTFKLFSSISPFLFFFILAFFSSLIYSFFLLLFFFSPTLPVTSLFHFKTHFLHLPFSSLSTW